MSHVTARTRFGFEPFKDPTVCAWTWRRLGEEFPDAVAAGEMPNHLHVLAPGAADDLRVRLSIVMRGVSRRFFRGKAIWEPVPGGRDVPDSKHLLRQIRYIHLNPCRDGLAADPLEWEWSTHRDWTGLVVDPWVDVARWSRRIGWPVISAPERMHRYVSGDPSVKVEGTPLFPPKPIDLRERLASPVLVGRAMEMATRAERGTASRRGPLRSYLASFLAEQSILNFAQIAGLLGVSRQAVRQASGCPEKLAERVRLILADDRLLRLSL